MFLFTSGNMWWLIFGCATLYHFQNAQAEGVYEFPGRYNSNRSSYSGYINPSLRAAFLDYMANKRLYESDIPRAYYPGYSVTRGIYEGGVATGGAYPNYSTRRVMYPTSGVGYPGIFSSVGERIYTESAVRRVTYPITGLTTTSHQSSTRVVNPNVASGVEGTSYQTNGGSGVVGTSYQTSRGSGVVGTSYQTNRGSGVDNVAGSIPPNTNTVGGTYPVSSFNNDGSTSSNTNTVGIASSGTRIFTSLSTPKQKVKLDVYYETNCPDSMRFITNQLTPLYRELKDILDVRMVPFGKGQAYYDSITKQYQFRCHHGPDECYGNTIQGCSMTLHPDVETHLHFIDCMMSYPRPSANGQKCARRLSLDWKPILKCAEGEEGQRILYRNGQLTNSLNPTVNFVPWINVNNVHTDEIQRRALRDLKSVVCGAYEGSHPKC